MSILGMMQGTLLSKIIFTGFLNFLVFQPTKAWIIRSILFVIGVIIINKIPEENPVQTTIHNNIVYLNMFRGVVLAWMVYILYLIILPLNKWKK
jgi:hypothetical protein